MNLNKIKYILESEKLLTKQSTLLALIYNKKNMKQNEISTVR